ncbi:hypothetical protein D3C81_727550 [compost metagenome]
MFGLKRGYKPEVHLPSQAWIDSQCTFRARDRFVVKYQLVISSTARRAWQLCQMNCLITFAHIDGIHEADSSALPRPFLASNLPFVIDSPFIQAIRKITVANEVVVGIIIFVVHGCVLPTLWVSVAVSDELFSARVSSNASTALAKERPPSRA